MANNKTKAKRYVVHHIHEWKGFKEDAWVGYDTGLDDGKVSALSMATHTAIRYHGEIFVDYGNGELLPFKNYKRPEKV